MSSLSRATNASITAAGALSPMSSPDERSNALPNGASRERYRLTDRVFPLTSEVAREKSRLTHLAGPRGLPIWVRRAAASYSRSRLRSSLVPFQPYPREGCVAPGPASSGEHMPSPAMRPPVLPSSPLRRRGARRSRTNTAIDEQNRFSCRGPMHPWGRAPRTKRGVGSTAPPRRNDHGSSRNRRLRQMTVAHFARCTQVNVDPSPACQSEHGSHYDDAEPRTLPNAPSTAACRSAKRNRRELSLFTTSRGAPFW